MGTPQTVMRCCVSWTLALVLATAVARADRSELPSGIGVFIGEPGVSIWDSTAKIGSLNPGELAIVYVLGDRVELVGSVGVNGARFGLDVDPRLVVLSKGQVSLPYVALAFEREPNEWDVGFNACASGNPAFVQYVVQLPADAVDIGDLRIDVRDLAEGPMAYSRCTPNPTLERAFSAGGVVFNPSSPSIVHFSSSDDVHVEGRPLRFAWETHGAGTVRLDGIVVQPSGSTTLQANSDHTYLLQAETGGSEVSRPLFVDVIRKPRVEYFTAHLVPPANTSVQLHWSVRGTNIARLSTIGPNVSAFGSRVVPLRIPATWDLTASNEWGSVVEEATVYETPTVLPVVLEFRVTPSTVPLGEQALLSWTVFNADQISVSPEIGSVSGSQGSHWITVTEPTTYTLTATNGGGSVEATTAVSIGAPRINYFESPSGTYYPGFPTTLSWDIDGATSAEILPGVGPVDPGAGSVTVTPDGAQASFTLFAYAPGTESSRELQLIGARPLALISASDTEAYGGESVELSLVLEGAESALLEPGIGSIPPITQTLSVQVDSTTTFVLSGTNSLGTISNSTTVTALPPDIQSFALSEPVFFPGESTDLTWAAAGGVSAEILPDIGPVDPTGGSLTLTPETEPITYTFRVINATGFVEQELVVAPSPPVLSISTLSVPVWGGIPAQIELEILGADTAILEPWIGPIEPVNQVVDIVIGNSTTFILTATNAAGQSTHEHFVQTQRPIVNLRSEQSTVYVGEPVTLTATILGALEASLSPGPGSIPPTTADYQIVIQQTTTFTLTGSNATGSNSVDLRIVANPSTPPPLIHEFIATPATITPGASSQLSWTVERATHLQIEPGSFETDELVGSLQVSPTASTEYTLTAFNDIETATATSTIVVSYATPEVISFSANPSSIISGSTSLLSWNVQNAEEITIEPGGFVTTDLVGSLAVTPQTSTTYELTARNGPNSRVRTTSINVVPFRIQSFSAIPTEFQPGEPITVAWSVTGDADVELLGFGPQELEGSLVDYPMVTTTYELHVSNGSSQQVRRATVTIPGTEPPVLTLSADPAGTQQVIDPYVFEPFDVYIVMQAPLRDLNAFEFQVDLGAFLFLQDSELLLPGAVDEDPAPDVFRAQSLTCSNLDGPTVLARLEILMLGTEATGALINAVGLSEGSSVTPPAPAFRRCDQTWTAIPIVQPLEIGGGFISVLEVDLRVVDLPDVRAIQWTLDRAPAELVIWRGSSTASMSPQANLPLVAAGNWTDPTASLDRAEYYRLEAVIDGTRLSSEAILAKPSVPFVSDRTRLLANVPNPFNPSTEIRFVLEKPGSADVDIYDVSGRRVFHRPFHGLTAGEHFFVWGGLDRSGRSVSSGVYLVRLNADGRVDSRSITLVE